MPQSNPKAAARWPNHARAAGEDVAAYLLMIDELAGRLDAQGRAFDAAMRQVHDAMDAQDWRTVRYLVGNQRGVAADVRSAALSIRNAAVSAKAVLGGAMRGEYGAGC
jgi:hypothetical protein